MDGDLPFLKAYLAKASALPSPSVWPALASCGGVLVGSIALGYALFGLIGWFSIPVTLLFGIPGIAALIGWARTQATKARTPEAQRLADLRAAASEMNALKKRRLAKRLGPSMAALLEEAARHYFRVEATLNGPLWTDPRLPAHRRLIREQALASAEAGMGDLVLMAHALLAVGQGKPEWHEEVREFFDDLLGKPVLPEDFRSSLPTEFEPARALVERLQMLAAEVERATLEVPKDEAAQSFSSISSLDATLHELKQVRQAEEEMRQHMGQQ